MKIRSFRIKMALLFLCLTTMMVCNTAVYATATDNSANSEDIIILYTNDVHCGVDSGVSYAGLALYKKQMEEISPYVTLVDAGDVIQGAPIGTLSEGEYLIEIMNELGYDFAVPGNHEYDYGMERFLELTGELDCGYYSCNFMDLQTGEAVFDGYKLFEYVDVTVAYVGVTTPESFTKGTPAYFQDENGEYIYGFCEDDTGEALYEQVQATVDDARAEGADYVILVAHLGETGVTEYWTSDAVLLNTTGIDACIDGHSHETYVKYVPNEDGEDVLLTQTGTKLATIGQMTIQADGTISAELVEQVPEEGESCISTDEGLAVDEDAYQFIQEIEAQYQDVLETVIGSSDVELTDSDPETGERLVRMSETNLGDFVADAYRCVLEADIGICNGGGIRDGISVGDVTYEDALMVLPFGNMGCVVEATGQQILDALEMGARNYPEENGGFLQVSGLSYTIDTSVSSSVQLDDKGNFVSVDGEYRVTDVLVNGEPLELDQTYTVASHDYMLKSGGSGMSMFQDATVLRDNIISDMDMMFSYIMDNLGGTIGEEYADYYGQGRITIQ
ncbi:MAG: bifunctional metallophosphatase/5'-nucleotidase [Clostridiales bacterium]|nr:bifunctional metallophosphatase/5'-nucleotidase [Clostridiales bacterium]